MKVYVIIVTYNGIKWIEKCLNSVFNSTLSINVIVVDNNSSDETVNFIKTKFQQAELIEQRENLGFGGANNLGIKTAYASGADYFFLLNQDAWIESDTIEKLIGAHRKESKFGIVSPIHLNGTGDALDYKFSKFIEPSRCKQLFSDIYVSKIKNNIYEANFVNAAAWLLSRQCIKKVGGFNPSFFHYGEDINYVQRIKYHNLKIGVYAHCVVFHDREYRSENHYFENPKEVYKRELLLKISNPNENFSLSKEYLKLYKLFLKSLLFFRWKQAKIVTSKYKILNDTNKKAIFKNVAESKKEQPSFL